MARPANMASNNRVFVQRFPWFELIPKGQSNGLSHVANQITATDSGAIGSTLLASETTAISYVEGTYNRVTYPVAIFGTGRGVTFKELAAVRAGGAPLQPLEIELKNGMTALARDVQYTLFVGNATNSGGTAANEGGPYLSYAFDGLRGVTGSYGSWSTNNATQVDIGSANQLDSIKACAARISNNGGNPTIALMSKLAKDALDQEQGANKRYTDNTVEAVAGMRFNTIASADTDLTIISVPGNTLGTYQRTSDNATVEDIYLLDMDHIMLRWLYAPTFTVLEIPSGVDGVLSSRYLVFIMCTLEQAAPVYSGKVRRISA